MASTVETEGRNGNLEVNGHASPNGVFPDVKPVSDVCGNEKEKSKSADTNHKQNSEAFNSNQSATSDKESPKEGKAPDSADDVQKADDKVAESVSAKGEKPDEKVVGASSEKSEDKSTEESKEGAEDSPKDEPDAQTEQPAKGTEQDLDKQADTIVESTSEAPKFDAQKSVDSDVPKEDVEMPDAPSQVERGKEPTTTDAKPDPAAEADTQASTIVSAAVESSQASQPAPATADTSMSDAPSSTKTPRERDDDEEEVPAAKRPRIDSPKTKTEAEVTTGTTEISQPMDVDSTETTGHDEEVSLYLPDGLPKPLGHPSLDHTRITEFQSKQLRTVLAGVKKTKNGMNFRQSVQTLWPGFWADYSAKITNPVDISSFEKRLRGEAKPYSNMAAFKVDVDLLVQNAITFNGEAHDIAKSAVLTREEILTRMEQRPAVEALKIEKKDTVKHQPKRHAEQRAPQPAPPPPPPPAKPKPPAPVVQLDKAAIDQSPAFAIPPNNNGIPLIRRDSTKVGDNRPKRPVKPPKSKDLPDDAKKRKKLSPELRFCEVVLQEITKSRHWNVNNAFMEPVDPVALNIPQYHKIVKKPMDLRTMGTKLAQGEYSNAKDFEKDFNLIVKNCKDFNGETHPVTEQAIALQALFKGEWANKDTWIAKNAPPAESRSHASGNSPPPKGDDSEEEDVDSEDEPMHEESKPTVSAKLQTLEKRLKEEQSKIEKEMHSAKPDITMVEVSQNVINTLQLGIINERNRLAEEVAKKSKSKPAKAKKPTGPAGGGSAGKKAAAAVSGAAAGSKKAGGNKKAGKRRIGALEKEVIADGIADLDGKDLERAIDIIKRDTGTGENNDGELELDIEVLSNDALVKLYEIVTRTFPNLMGEKRAAAAQSSDPVVPEPAPAKSKGTKTKKNKPMSKGEQEARLAQLSQLRAAAQRQGSGSQEPIESIEDHGGQPASAISETAPAFEHDSVDEESSEEE